MHPCNQVEKFVVIVLALYMIDKGPTPRGMKGCLRGVYLFAGNRSSRKQKTKSMPFCARTKGWDWCSPWFFSFPINNFHCGWVHLFLFNLWSFIQPFCNTLLLLFLDLQPLHNTTKSCWMSFSIMKSGRNLVGTFWSVRMMMKTLWKMTSKIMESS